MRFSLSRSDKNQDQAEDRPKFICKECKMVFQSKQSLKIHKNKAKHFTGSIYFGKHDS
jgi:uncharacterized C2H2 Zn-finger protein